MTETLDQIIERIAGKSQDELRALEAEVDRKLGPIHWTPTPGPQTEAYLSKADIMLYGGQAGGGKTDLLLGLAFNEHDRSLIMRRQYGDLSAVTTRAIEINGTRAGYSGAPPPSFQTYNNRLIEFGGCANPGDEQRWQGQPHDFIGFDEGAQLLEQQVRFIMGWLRTTKEGQRCRVVIASNPPLSDEGQWLLHMFSPWLDPAHPRPAESGELRWYITDPEGFDVEVDQPGVYKFEDGKPYWFRRSEQLGRTIPPNEYLAQSRTFIPASTADNPYITAAYRATLDAMPEPLRSAMRDGNFQAGAIDDPFQLLPTQWLLEAQSRWTKDPPKNAPMTAMGVDVAQGGTNNTVIACRYDWWFAPLISVPGRETPKGRDVAALVMKHREHHAQIIIDMGGGYGSAPYEHLEANQFPVVGFNGASGSGERTQDRMIGFINLRAQACWRFREALDPSQPQGSPIALPYDQELLSDLVSMRFEVTPNGIKVEDKKAIMKRLGRSIDKGDAVIMAWFAGPTWVTHGQEWRDYTKRASSIDVRRAYDKRKAMRRKV